MIDPDDVQDIVLEPKPSERVDLAFLHFAGSRSMLQEFLAAAADDVGTARRANPAKPSVNVGLTAAGLRLLGLPARAMEALPATFREGMRAAAHRLGDIGPSDPAGWIEPFAPASPPVHAVVLAAGAKRDERPGPAADDRPAWFGLDRFVGQHGLVTWTGRRLPGGTEPFGFKDAMSNPVLEGSGKELRPGNGVWDVAAQRWRRVRAGEAVLGHVDESGTVAGHQDAAFVERNGSYLVLRKLAQDAAGFDRECDRWGGEVGLTRTQVAERMVGRRKGGEPLHAGDGDVGNGFLYRDGGPAGRAIPPSSHIRRSNPRDDLEAADRIVPRHLLFRRGIPYHDDEADGGEQGLLFLAVCADLRRQFEFVQSHWLQDGNRFGFGREPDPLTGARHKAPGQPRDARHRASISGPGSERRVCPELPSFVTTRGGEYFLLPGRSTIAHLATIEPRP